MMEASDPSGAVWNVIKYYAKSSIEPLRRSRTDLDTTTCTNRAKGPEELYKRNRKLGDPLKPVARLRISPPSLCSFEIPPSLTLTRLHVGRAAQRQ